MLNVLFYLRGFGKCTQPSEELVITCQLILEDQPRDTAFSLKIKIPKKYWWTYLGKDSADGEWVDSAYYNAEFVNKRLRDTEQTLRNIVDVLPLLYPDEPITYNHIRRHYDPDSAKIIKATQRKTTPSVERIYTEFLEHKIQKRGIKELTQKSYRSRMNNIYEFFGKNKPIDCIRHRDLDKFENWLMSQKNKDNNLKFCRNYRNKHLTLVFDLVAFAVKKEYLDAMPLVSLELKYDADKPPQYLLPAQRAALQAVDIPSLERAKDIAQFLMHTGFSWIDYINLKSEHLMGKCWRVQRQKSDTWSMPILLDEAQAIIEKYGSIEALPRPDDSDLNKELKHLASIAKIDTNLEHPLRISDFRETFASMLENEFMFEQRVVQVMMGHKNARQIQSYSRLMPSRVLYELEQWKKRVGMN
ncbi:site-specific recombinase XerD [Arcicella aurantiaca]|uniref:Site-specific recombinase XerD n=1 Tax=Arcicella aurantiaca TaxID=591202 RepID=A0A316EVI7_9BACT|nr:tyrosine-type recombinase/integrase [Arcicella aurantiaca]PWK27216.1 site-specific recombinase XerD [Arcicella aurantiaca]